MTRKDYELLAATFAATKPDPDTAMYRQWERDIRAVSDALQAENPRFDRGRFQYAATAPIVITTPRWNVDGSRKS